MRIEAGPRLAGRLDDCMAFPSIMQILFGLMGLFTGALMLVAGIVAFRAVRNAGTIVLLVGTILAILSRIFWLVFQFMQSSGNIDHMSRGVRAVLSIMQGLSMLSGLLVALGMLMVAFVLGDIWRQNRALEDIMAGSKTDRIA